MSPAATQLLGAAATLYGVGGALSVLLQARQMRLRGSSGDVSARFLAVYVGGFAVWLLYGLSIGDFPIIVVHAVGLLCGAVTLAVTLRLRGPLAETTATRDKEEYAKSNAVNLRFELEVKSPAPIPEHGSET